MRESFGFGGDALGRIACLSRNPVYPHVAVKEFPGGIGNWE